MANSEDQPHHPRRNPRVQWSLPLVRAWASGEPEGLENGSPESSDEDTGLPQSSMTPNERPSGHVDSFADIDAAPLNPSGYEADIDAYHERANSDRPRRPRMRAMQALRNAALAMQPLAPARQGRSDLRSTGEPDIVLAGNPSSQRWSNTNIPPAMALYDSGWRRARPSDEATTSVRRVARSDESDGLTTEPDVLETRARGLQTEMLTMLARSQTGPSSAVPASQNRVMQQIPREDPQSAVELPTDNPASVSGQQRSASGPSLGPLNDSDPEQPSMTEIARLTQRLSARASQVQQLEDILEGLLRILERQAEVAREERLLMERLANVVESEISAQIAAVEDEQRRIVD